jgi:general secretion pathway protein L
VATYFLFAGKMDDEGCLSLGLDFSGHVVAPLQTRSFAEIKSLQKEARTIVVVPTEMASIHEVEFPWLGERKARAALPYALEEQLAQPVPTLHFAFDRSHYTNQRYLVVVLDKQYLEKLIQNLNDASLAFDAFTLDWFAVLPGQAVFTEKSLLVHDAFKGALDGELIKIFLTKHAADHEILQFDDSNPAYPYLEIYTKKEGSVELFIAQQLLKNTFINLLQGEFYRDATKDTAKFWYQLGGGAFLLWLVSLIMVNTIQLISLNKKIANFDEQIGVIYKEFFPDAQHVISPRFRITQLLKSSANLQNNSIWILLDKIAPALRENQLKVQQFRFQNQTLAMTLNAKNFEILENLQSRLIKAGIKVTQTQASSQDNQVLATLELNL